MPLKFKIYFECACYLLLWAGFWVIDNLCDIIFKRNSDMSGNIQMMLAMQAIFIIGAVPIRMIFHYRRATHPTPNGKLLFIVSYGFNIMTVLVLSGILFYTWLFWSDYTDVATKHDSLSSYLSLCSIVVAWVSCLTLLIFNPVLSKAVRGRYNATHTIKVDF